MIISLAEKLINGYFAIVPRCPPSKEIAQDAVLIAHRGAHHHIDGVLENTLAAFRLAQKVGCWGIELDIHSTSDQVWVVNHDSSLKRIWGKNGEISDICFRDLRKQIPGIPTLSEVIDEFGGKMHLFIELKSPVSNEASLYQLIGRLRPCVDYHFLTLNSDFFTHFTLFSKQALLLVALHHNVSHFCDLCIQEDYGGVLGNYLLLTNKHLRRLKNSEKSYGVGFVDSKYSLYRELHRGVRWLFTNQAVGVSHHLAVLKS